MLCSDQENCKVLILLIFGFEFGEVGRERAILLQGVKDGIAGDKTQIAAKKYSGHIRSLFRERGKKLAAKMEEEGAKYLADFVAGKGGTKSESGIGYKMVREGSGKHPQPSDRVKVHYHGTLIDGTVFDSSVERGKPLTFPLNGVIRCWKEGVQKVKVGGKIQLVCPAAMAYGQRGAPPKIPGGATLVFDVELLEIVAAKKSSQEVSKKRRGRKKSKAKKK